MGRNVAEMLATTGAWELTQWKAHLILEAEERKAAYEAAKNGGG